MNVMRRLFLRFFTEFSADDVDEWGGWDNTMSMRDVPARRWGRRCGCQHYCHWGDVGISQAEYGLDEARERQIEYQALERLDSKIGG